MEFIKKSLDSLSFSKINTLSECTIRYELSRQYKVFNLTFTMGTLVHSFLELFANFLYEDDVNTFEDLHNKILEKEEKLISLIRAQLDATMQPLIEGNTENLLFDLDSKYQKLISIRDLLDPVIRDRLVKYIYYILSRESVLRKIFREDFTQNGIFKLLGNEMKLVENTVELFEKFGVNLTKLNMNIVGYADIIYDKGDGKYLIIDYKTQTMNRTVKEEESTNMQHLLYTFMLQKYLENYDINVENINLYIYIKYHKKLLDKDIPLYELLGNPDEFKLDKVVNIQITKYTDIDERDIEKFIHNVLSAVVPYTLGIHRIGQSKYGCDICPYKEKCPYYSKR